MSLRASLIRLAHTNPEVREKLIPLLREAASFKDREQEPNRYTGPEEPDRRLGQVFVGETRTSMTWFLPQSVTKSGSVLGLMVSMNYLGTLTKAVKKSAQDADFRTFYKPVAVQDLEPKVLARFRDAGGSVRVASTDHLAALVQPKGMKPTYQGNAMAVPLVWGGVGVMKPYDVARAMVPLFRAAKNGVAFVLDQNSVFSKPGISEVSRALEQAIKDQYGEEHAMTSEYFEDARPGSKDYENVLRAGAQATMADKVRVSITPVISPVSGKSGLKVVFRPTFEQIEAL